MPLQIKGEVEIFISPQVKIRLRERDCRPARLIKVCAAARHYRFWFVRLEGIEKRLLTARGSVN